MFSGILFDQVLYDFKARATVPKKQTQTSIGDISFWARRSSLCVPAGHVKRHHVENFDFHVFPFGWQLLEETEKEARLSEHWILKITEQDHLELKTLTQNFASAELLLLHRIQSKWMREHRNLHKLIASAKGTANSANIPQYQQQLRKLDNLIQMSILAISEALGFGG